MGRWWRPDDEPRRRSSQPVRARSGDHHRVQLDTAGQRERKRLRTPHRGRPLRRAECPGLLWDPCGERHVWWRRPPAPDGRHHAPDPDRTGDQSRPRHRSGVQCVRTHEDTIMPFTFKLSKRLALMKASLVPAAAAALTMCQPGDRGITGLTPPSKSIMQDAGSPDAIPVAYWNLDEGSGGVAVDASGKGNTATLGGGSSWAPGVTKAAVLLDGVSGQVSVPNSPALNPPGAFSIAVWVNPKVAASGFHAVVVKNYTYFLYASVSGYCGNGGVLAGFANTAVCTATPLAANTWTHLAVTYDGTTLSLFRNGVLVASRAASGAAPSSTGTLQIGASQFGEYFNGLIDEVRIYDRALSASDIQALLGAAPTPPVAAWRLDEGTGSVAADASGNGNAATLGGGSSWAPGVTKAAVLLDGVSGQVSVPNSPALNPPGAFSIAVWVNPKVAASGFHAVVVKNYTYFLYASVSGYCGNGGVLAGFANTAVCTATPLAANTWTHLAVTYDGTTLSLFRNGVLVASRAASGAA